MTTTVTVIVTSDSDKRLPVRPFMISHTTVRTFSDSTVADPLEPSTENPELDPVFADPVDATAAAATLLMSVSRLIIAMCLMGGLGVH